MIVTFPDMPPVDGPLKVPRPAVYLFGSYGASRVNWQPHVAKKLDRYAGCVAYGGRAVADPLYVQWSVFWLRHCDLAVCWIDGDPWSQFELGFSSARQTRMFVGAAEETVRVALEQALHALGFSPVVYETTEQLVAAAREQIGGERR